MEKIKTAKGKEFDTDLVATIPSPQIMYIRVLNSDIDKIQEVFSNPEETERIEYCGMTFDGYTKLGYIVSEDIAYKVRLSR